MKLKEHPRYDEFEAWFANQLGKAVHVRADLYRVAGPRYTTAADIVSGIGASKGGGRWNAPGKIRVVYLSTQPETALAEANEHFRYHALPLTNGLPKVVVAVRVEIDRVLDFTDAAVAKAFPEKLSTLLKEDWRAMLDRGDEATTQAMGRAAFAAGFQGLSVPSKPVKDGVNLLVFPKRMTKSNVLTVLNPDELEKLGKSS